MEIKPKEEVKMVRKRKFHSSLEFDEWEKKIKKDEI
jgi:hypothetical protein